MKMMNDEVKEKVMKNTSGGLYIHVKAVRKTSSGDLAIEVDKERDVGMLCECKKFGILGLKVKTPRKFDLKVVVFDVENEKINKDLANEVYVKNLKNAGVRKSTKKKQGLNE